MELAAVGATVCIVDGCVEPPYSRGICRAHYERWKKSGDYGPPHRLKARWGEGNRRPDGYAKVNRPTHPLAARDGRVYVHRAALYDRIGPGEHICYWCGKFLTWDAPTLATRITVDHRNYDPQDDSPTNLVPCCHSCNSGRTRRWLRPA